MARNGHDRSPPHITEPTLGTDRTPHHTAMLGGAWKLVRERDIDGALRWLQVNCHLRPFCGCGRSAPLEHCISLLQTLLDISVQESENAELLSLTVLIAWQESDMDTHAALSHAPLCPRILPLCVVPGSLWPAMPFLHLMVRHSFYTDSWSTSPFLVLIASQYTDKSAPLPASSTKENLNANSSGSSNISSSEAARRVSSIELLARLIHLSEQESCLDPLFVGFEDDISALFLQSDKGTVRPGVRAALVHELKRGKDDSSGGTRQRAPPLLLFKHRLHSSML